MYLLKNITAKMKQTSASVLFLFFIAIVVTAEKSYSYGWEWDNTDFINCMLTEIQKYPAANDIQDTIIASLPSTELYIRNYASPLWAPSFTGFALLITFIIIVVIFIRGIVWVFLRLSLLFV